MQEGYELDKQIKDVMHIVPKSQGGLGIEQNGVIGCRYHHMMMDNGNLGNRDDMLLICETYLKKIYPGWTRESVTYQKGVDNVINQRHGNAKEL